MHHPAVLAVPSRKRRCAPHGGVGAEPDGASGTNSTMSARIETLGMEYKIRKVLERSTTTFANV